MAVLLLGGILFALLGVWSHIIRTRDIIHVPTVVVRRARSSVICLPSTLLIPDESRFFQPISISLFEFHFSLSEIFLK